MMDKKRKITGWVIFATTVILIGYDVYAFLSGGSEATISDVLYDKSRENPLIPFAFGLLMGHLFAQIGNDK